MLLAAQRRREGLLPPPPSLCSEADTARRQAVSMHDGVVVVSALRLAKTRWQFCQGQPEGGITWLTILLNHDDGD